MEIDKAKVLAILDEGYAERAYQAKRWADGDVNTLNKNDDKKVAIPDTWCMWVSRYIGNWNERFVFPHEYNADDLRLFRKSMLKVMMLAVAAILWVDRKLEKLG